MTAISDHTTGLPIPVYWPTIHTLVFVPLDVGAIAYARRAARRMKDATFRQQQRDRRMDPHIAPINQLVADLQDSANGRWLP
jgi:hypothetical protein